jgi:hypothetical protein
VCACGEIEEKYLSSLSLELAEVLNFELVKVGGCDFTHPCDGPWNSLSFLIDLQ